VEGDVHLAAGADDASVDGDLSASGVDLGTQSVDYLAIDSDVSSDDQLFCCASGGDTGFGEEFLESDECHGILKKEKPMAAPGRQSAFATGIWMRLLRRKGLPETDDAVTVFPLAAGLEECDAFETLEDIALGASRTGGRAEAVVLRHKNWNSCLLLRPGRRGATFLAEVMGVAKTKFQFPAARTLGSRASLANLGPASSPPFSL
jgi:hypothetical protein